MTEIPANPERRPLRELSHQDLCDLPEFGFMEYGFEDLPKEDQDRLLIKYPDTNWERVRFPVAPAIQVHSVSGKDPLRFKCSDGKVYEPVYTEEAGWTKRVVF